MAGQVKDHGVGVFTGLISAGAVALIGELFKNAVSEGVKSGGIAFWLTMIAAALAMIIAYIFSYNYSVIFREYGLDGADPDERSVFDSLQARLAAGGRFVPLYNDLMTRALDRVDRFFGDADPAVKTLWPNFFGFQGNKPFWTAPSYDRCLLIALLYPLAVLFVVWGVSGEVGRMEAVLGLSSDTMWPQRMIYLTGLSIIFVFGIIFNITDVNNIKFLSLCVIGSCYYFIFFGNNNLTNAIAFGTVAILFFSRFGISAFALVTAGAVGSAGTIAGPAATVIAIFGFIINASFKSHIKRWEGLFLLVCCMILLPLCYIIANWLSGENGWARAGPLLLFFGVLTLVNAPFDWFSIGLTRALLRRGLEKEGFWPLGYALVDLLAATLLIALLAAAMVFAVDLFEVVGRSKIIHVDATLAALADPWQRGQTKYWWIYATLFSTLIPSILNVTVAALSLMRGLPWFHKTVAAKMRSGKPMMDIHLIWMPAALAFEVMIAVLAGLAVTAWWIFKAVPYLTRPVEWLIPLLEWVAALV